MNWRRRNAGGARRFAASSPEELIDTPDDVFAGETAKGKRRPAPQHVLRPARPLELARVQGLRADVGPFWVNRLEQVRIRDGRSKYLVGQAPVQVDEVRADRHVEVRQATGKPAHALVRVDRAR